VISLGETASLNRHKVEQAKKHKKTCPDTRPFYLSGGESWQDVNPAGDPLEGEPETVLEAGSGARTEEGKRR
jgi:hypothetical protein